MDTPEGDISALQSGAMEPFPTYSVQDDGHDSFQALLASLPHSLEGEDELDATIFDQIAKSGADTPSVIQSYPVPPAGQGATRLMRARQTIIQGFFRAIANSQDEAVTLFISQRLVTANTPNDGGKTPLLAAIDTRNIRTVKHLLAAGANPHAFGAISQTWEWDLDAGTRRCIAIQRTPLMHAAALGQFAVVKLLMEDFGVDDALVAPDGQIALRLAAANGHREIVDYLPARRGGGFLRWKTAHEKAIRRARKAWRKALRFVKFFVWDVEKFLLWTLPKDAVVKPLGRGCKWCWDRKQRLGPWCARQVKETPARVKRFAKAAWKGAKKVPGAVKEVSIDIWEFLTKDLPKAVKRFVVWCWNLVTKRIPHAIAILAKWIWGGVRSAAEAVWNIILKAVSLLHTALSAMLSFFQSLTLKDVWDGFCAFLRSIFITFPQTLGRWIVAFGETSYKAMAALFGGIGMCIWWILVGLGWLAVYVPQKLWIIICSMGGSFANGLHEVKVWVSPKA